MKAHTAWILFIHESLAINTNIYTSHIQTYTYTFHTSHTSHIRFFEYFSKIFEVENYQHTLSAKNNSQNHFLSEEGEEEKGDLSHGKGVCQKVCYMILSCEFFEYTIDMWWLLKNLNN